MEVLCKRRRGPIGASRAEFACRPLGQSRQAQPEGSGDHAGSLARPRQRPTETQKQKKKREALRALASLDRAKKKNKKISYFFFTKFFFQHFFP